MPFDSVWIIGSSRSGKTARLVDQFCLWVESGRNGQGQLANRRQMQYTQANLPQRLNAQQSEPAVLVLAANDDNRRDLANRMVAATAGKYPIPSKTPLGFFRMK